MIEFILLGFLMRREMTGYDLKQCMSQSTANFYDASYGSIYPALKRMEKGGYVQVREEATGSRVRKLYAIQPSGRQRFLDWMISPLEISKTASELLLRVFFLDFLESAKAIALIAGYQDRVEAAMAHLEAIEPQVRSMAGPFQLATLLYGKEHYRHQSTWCQGILDTLKELAERSNPHENCSSERQS